MAKTEIEIINGKRLNDTTARAAAAKNAEAIEELKKTQGSGGNAALSDDLKTALINYYTHVMPIFDDDNGLAYINAILTALGAETRGEQEEPDTPVEPDEPDTPEVTLTSISANYSGGDVAVGTALNDLTGIVVTAHYSDGTSETVTGYTLSGEIAEGSNTVTVSYGGKTTTVTVTGVAESGGEETEVAMTRGETAVCVYSDDGETELRGGNGTYYVSDEVFEEDTVVTITVLYGTTNAALKQYAACAPSDSVASAYYGEEIGSASVKEYQATYTVKAGYRLLIKNYNSGVPNSITVTK